MSAQHLAGVCAGIGKVPRGHRASPGALNFGYRESPEPALNEDRALGDRKDRSGRLLPGTRGFLRLCMRA